MTIFTDIEKCESLTPTIYTQSQNNFKSWSLKNESTQTLGMSTDFFVRTHNPKHDDSRIKTPFPELLNSSGILKKFDIAPNSTMTVKPFDVSQTNSCLMTADRNPSSKDRPASVIQKKKNTFEFTRKSSSNDSIHRNDGRYTPIGKLEILCEDGKRNKESKSQILICFI